MPPPSLSGIQSERGQPPFPTLRLLESFSVEDPVLAIENNMSEQKQFSGRAAIVTGATRGIGRAIALELARRGADVAFNYAKSADAAESLTKEIEDLGARVRGR